MPVRMLDAGQKRFLVAFRGVLDRFALSGGECCADARRQNIYSEGKQTFPCEPQNPILPYAAGFDNRCPCFAYLRDGGGRVTRV
jgi:hypothetical protein